jgi:hypothetical protein
MKLKMVVKAHLWHNLSDFLVPSVYTFKFNMKGFARNILATLPLVASTLGAILNGN